MADPSIRDEELPLLHSEHAQNSPEQIPFPWLQFSIIFSLKTAEFLTSKATHPFIPDVRLPQPLNLFTPFLNHSLPLAGPTYRDNGRREGRRSLCRIAGKYELPRF